MTIKLYYYFFRSFGLHLSNSLCLEFIKHNATFFFCILFQMREQFSISLFSILSNSAPLPQTHHIYQVQELGFCLIFVIGILDHLPGLEFFTKALSIGGYMLQACPSQELDLFTPPVTR